MILSFILAVLAIVVDQVTKVLLYGKSFSLIGDFLWIESPELNTGASFGIFSGKTVYLIIFTIPVLIFMIYLIATKRFTSSKFFKCSLGLILGGTIGNLIDRLAFGGVRDFIYLKSINFAIFNFADIFINVGIFMIVGWFIYSWVKEARAQKLEQKSNENKVVSETSNDKSNENVQEQGVDQTRSEKINELKNDGEKLENNLKSVSSAETLESESTSHASKSTNKKKEVVLNKPQVGKKNKQKSKEKK